MSIQTRKFVYVDKGFFDPCGWRMADRPHFDVCHSLWVVGHDTFEHNDADTDTLEDEFMAFGSVYLIRVRGKWNGWDSIDHAVHSWWNDFSYFLNKRQWTVAECDELIPEDEEAREFFNKLYAYGDNMLNVLFPYAGQERELTQRRIALQNALCWTFKGYKRALALWGNNEPKDIMSMFSTTLDRLSHGTYGGATPVVDGDTLSIMFNTETLDVHVEINVNVHGHSVDMFGDSVAKTTYKYRIGRNALGFVEGLDMDIITEEDEPLAMAA